MYQHDMSRYQPATVNNPEKPARQNAIMPPVIPTQQAASSSAVTAQVCDSTLISVTKYKTTPITATLDATSAETANESKTRIKKRPKLNHYV